MDELKCRPANEHNLLNQNRLHTDGSGVPLALAGNASEAGNPRDLPIRRNHERLIARGVPHHVRRDAASIQITNPGPVG